MNHLFRILSLPSASAYIFFSGIFTSLATNLFTGDRSANSQVYEFIKCGEFSDYSVHLSRVFFTLIIGAMLFWLGYIREDSSRKADFVRGDETTEVEYFDLVLSAFQQKSHQVLIAFVLLLVSILVVINISAVL